MVECLLKHLTLQTVLVVESFVGLLPPEIDVHEFVVLHLHPVHSRGHYPTYQLAVVAGTNVELRLGYSYLKLLVGEHPRDGLMLVDDVGFGIFHDTLISAIVALLGGLMVMDVLSEYIPLSIGSHTFIIEMLILFAYNTRKLNESYIYLKLNNKYP